MKRLALLTLAAVLWSCDSPVQPEPSSLSEQLRRDPRTVLMLNEALRADPDEARLARIMDSMYADYGPGTIDGNTDRVPCLVRGLRPAIGGDRCDYDALWTSAVTCALQGTGAYKLVQPFTGAWGQAIIGAGVGANCIRLSYKQNCDVNWTGGSFGGPGGGGGGSAW